MKNYLLSILILCVFCGCSQSENHKISEPIEAEINIKEPDSAKLERIFNNPFRDINNFEFLTGNKYIDSLRQELTSREDIVTTTNKDLCLGDNCESYQTLVDKPNGTVFYLSKGDSYEYGFTNYQYVLKGDSLAFVRNFNVKVEHEPSDSTETVWRIEEITNKFQDGSTSSYRKTLFTKDLDQADFSMKNISPHRIKLDFRKTYLHKMKELNRLLSLKDSPNLD